MTPLGPLEFPFLRARWSSNWSAPEPFAVSEVHHDQIVIPSLRACGYIVHRESRQDADGCDVAHTHHKSEVAIVKALGLKPE